MGPSPHQFYPPLLTRTHLSLLLNTGPPLPRSCFARWRLTPISYFCREYLEGYFLNHPVHSKYIDVDVLKQYYPVGGVRIEDDILVTEDGYENLTSAPKGEEMLRIINGE